MSEEKRFRINTLEIGSIYIDNLDGEHMSWIEVENTLNSLLRENEDYKEAVNEMEKYIKRQDRNQELYDFQIKQLKEEIVELQEDNVDTIVNLKKENDQLRFQLEECSNNKLFSRRELEKENEQLRKDHKRQENQIKLLNKQLTKIPPKIREVWVE